MNYDSDSDDSETETSLGGDSGNEADTESAGDEDDGAERRRRSGAPSPTVKRSNKAGWNTNDVLGWIGHTVAC